MPISRLNSRAFSWTFTLVVGASLGAGACSDDADEGEGVGGSSAGSSGSGSGTGGMAGSGAAGSGGGSSGSAGAGVSGSGGGSGDGGAAGSGDVDAGRDAGDDAAALTFTLSSPAFDNNPGCGPGDDADACDLFPVENTGLGDGPANISPEFLWVGAPAGTESFAIAMHDLSFLQGGNPFTHWVMWNIPATETGLPANLPSGASPGVPSAETGQISFGDDDGFAGSGACGNVYEFVLFALSVPSFEPEGNNQNQVEDEIAASDDVIATTTLRARSNPDGPCNPAP